MELRIIKSRRTFQKSSHGPRFTTDWQPQNHSLQFTADCYRENKAFLVGICALPYRKERTKGLDSVQSLLLTASGRTKPLSIHAVPHHENGTGSLHSVLSLLHTSSGRPKPVSMYVMSQGNNVPNVCLHTVFSSHSASLASRERSKRLPHSLLAISGRPAFLNVPTVATQYATVGSGQGPLSIDILSLERSRGVRIAVPIH